MACCFGLVVMFAITLGVLAISERGCSYDTVRSVALVGWVALAVLILVGAFVVMGTNYESKASRSDEIQHELVDEELEDDLITLVLLPGILWVILTFVVAHEPDLKEHRARFYKRWAGRLRCETDHSQGQPPAKLGNTPLSSSDEPSRSTDQSSGPRAGEATLGGGPGSDTQGDLVSWQDRYTQDAGCVYFCGSRVVESEPKTFEILGGGYSRDLHHVFYFTEKVKGANPATFEVVDARYRLAKDRYCLYRQGQVVERFDTRAWGQL